MIPIEHAAADAAPEGKNRLVLLVDSNGDHRTAHAMILLRHEFRVSSAASAAEALQMAATDVPALVITELDLPVMSGRDLLRCLRDVPRTASIPVIALSANGDHTTEARCLRDGFAACLRTPVGAEDLYRSVQSALVPVPGTDGGAHKIVPVVVNNAPLNSVEGVCASVVTEHGMYLRTLRPHPPNSTVSLRINVGGRTITTDAVVLFSHQFGDNAFGEYGMAIQFARMTARDREFLKRYLHNETSPQ